MDRELCPRARWVAVVDAAGRRHLEMRWTVPAAAGAETAVRAA